MNDQRFKIKLFFPIEKKLQSYEYLITPGMSLKKFLDKIEAENLFDANEMKFGIFGKIVEMNYIIKEGDRVEVYHKASQDPKIARVKRVKSKKKLKS